MLIELSPEENHNNVLMRAHTGLYVENADSYEELWELQRKLKENFYEFRHQYPEFQGDVDSRMAVFRELCETNTHYTEYGSCDSLEQFRETDVYGILHKLPHQFIVMFRYMTKEHYAGYRWHKNGPHIGLKEPQYESFGDETEIDSIYHFQIYRKK